MLELAMIQTVTRGRRVKIEVSCADAIGFPGARKFLRNSSTRILTNSTGSLATTLHLPSQSPSSGEERTLQFGGRQ